MNENVGDKDATLRRWIAVPFLAGMLAAWAFIPGNVGLLWALGALAVAIALLMTASYRWDPIYQLGGIRT